MKKKDFNQLARSVVAMAVGAIEKPLQKNKLKQLGGIKGGKARSENLTSKQRSDIAKKAAAKRWEK